MNTFDLNINNYNFDDLQKLFKVNIDNVDNINTLQNDLSKKINNSINNFPPEIKMFFSQAKTIILFIYEFISNKLITKTDISEYKNKLTKMDNLQTKSYNEVYSFIFNIMSPEVDNEPFLNTDSRINPSLNNRNNTNVVYNTVNNEIAPGDLNSVKRVTQLLNLNINSCFRTNYYQSNPCDFLYMIPSEITKVVSMRLVSIEIPNSWYLISKDKKNNKFFITTGEESKQTDYEITIPDGNYNSDTLQEYLNKTYFYESDVETELKFIKFEINNLNLKSSFSLIDDVNIFFSLKFNENINHNIMDTFGWILGFRLNCYLKGEQFISEGLFDAGGDRYIYLSINDFQYNSNSSNIVCFDQSILNEDVMAKIPMINGKLSLIVNDNNNSLAKIRRYNGPVSLNRLQIKILDKFGTIIDLNNMDFSLTLELELLYENFNFKNITS